MSCTAGGTEHLTGAVDARGDAAGDVLAGHASVLCADATLEFRPGDEFDVRLSAEPSATPAASPRSVIACSDAT